MSDNLIQNITSQLQGLNLPQDQLNNVLSQVTNQFGGDQAANMSQDMIQNGLAGILNDNGIQQDLVGQVMNNLKDGFQVSDITEPLQQAAAGGFMQKIMGMFGMK
jgi:hypothetical protein